LNISSNLTLELFDQPFLLEKRIELLFAIGRTGSISKAAKEVPMSYKTAWEAVDSMNNLANTPVVIRETGGAGGGGTELTEYGINLLRCYTQLQNEHRRFLRRLQDLTNIDTASLSDIGRLGLQISARNQIQGIIKAINSGAVTSEIVLKLKSGNELTSMITNSAVESLNLQVDNEVLAIFKSSSVQIVECEGHGENSFNGRVKHLYEDEKNVEIIFDIGEEETLISVINAKRNHLSVGTEACAFIDAKDVMIGR
jgi:molybdate transport system regulatory protein